MITLPSTARILYDDAAVYVAVQLSDPHPDSIVAPFPRRDEEVTSDWVFVEIDTRFDRRSGFSFGLNPRGVQVDGTWWNDVTYDPAWNGVWQGAAVMTADGWSAEFRIPFSQLALARVASGDALTWGLNIYRHTHRIAARRRTGLRGCRASLESCRTSIASKGLPLRRAQCRSNCCHTARSRPFAHPQAPAMG